jgi:lipopolysaccharide/colanic/teichoic acid biosynthesis glycosyltransferase
MFYRVSKRVLDILFSLILWVIVSPVVLLISVLIKIQDGGEIFVGTPVRFGLNGKSFFMYKFRTMVPNAHTQVNQFNYIHKVINDSRVTKLGKILRRWDLDELPQLINVILGQMSIVGPRPFYEEEIEQHLKEFPEDEKYFIEIHKVRPGLTGIWQVSGRNEIPFRKRLKMEYEYVNNRDIIKDIGIILKTPYVILSGKGKLNG